MRYTIEQLDAMEGHEFEYAVADLLVHNGWRDVEVTQGSGDYGVDILARRKSTRYAIQCKRYNSAVSVKAVQEAGLGTDYYHCDAAAVITNNTFTKNARKLADTTGVKLWDRKYLEDLLENYDEEYDELDSHATLATLKEKTEQGRQKETSPVPEKISADIRWTQADEETYRKVRTAFWLCLFLGYFGIHRFYLKKTGTGVLWLLTLGLALIGWIADLIWLGTAWWGRWHDRKRA